MRRFPLVTNRARSFSGRFNCDLGKVSFFMRVLISNPLASLVRGPCIGTLFLSLCCLVPPPACHAQSPPRDVIDLSGTWSVRLADSPQLHDVRMPGALRDSGVGMEPGPETKWIASSRDDIWDRPEYRPYRTDENFKFPFWLQPNLHYVGKATYLREISIPDDWSGRRVVLTLERPHWLTKVMVDGEQVGHGESLGVAHRFDLTDHLRPGTHQLAVEVDNSIDVIDVGINSHSVSDHTQSAWHGIVGAIELTAHPLVSVERVDVHPDVKESIVRAEIVLSNSLPNAEARKIVMRVVQDGRTLATHQTTVEVAPGQSTVRADVHVGSGVLLWDEFDPNLCELSVTLQQETRSAATRSSQFESSASDTSSEWKGRFGFREIVSRDGRLLLNDHPIFLRGTLECCIFPLTGYPPTDESAWRRIIGICKEHGLNHMRFHSWCPPEAAFVAADELGFYFQVECSTWPNKSVALGRGYPIDKWIYREADRVLAQYGNHPSFVLLCAGNEPAGEANGGKFLSPWVEHYKQLENRVLVTSGGGWPMIAANEYHVTPRPRIQQWGQQLSSRINARAPETVTDYDDFVGQQNVPVVAHEIGQWCAYPNFDEIVKYTGALKPKNFDIFRDFLENAGMLDQAREFLMASGRWQVLTYKEEVESALRTRHFGGFQLLDMRDFPGQGTALVGVLDPFWDPKPYLNPGEFRKFCGPVIPLARMPKRVWKQSETFTADVDVSHFGNAPLNGNVAWRIRDASARGDDVIASGQWTLDGQTPGDLYSIGEISLPLKQIPSACKWVLEITVPDGDQLVTNDWDLWVYPSDAKTVRDHETAGNGSRVTITENVSDAVAAAERGERVLLTVAPDMIDTDAQIGMSPIFWNWAWTSGQAPHTMGILCDPDHACLEGFPTEFHSNWQWWDVISKSAAMPLDNFPAGFQPLIQVVPNWFIPQKLALAWEAKMGKGRILVTSIDFSSDIGERPAARQLFASLQRYLSSDDFDPVHRVTEEQIESLMRELSETQLAVESIQASSMQSGYESSLVIDGDLETMWHTQWDPRVKPPHWLELTLHDPRLIEGVIVTPRQDRQPTRIRGYEVLVCDEYGMWQSVVSGEFDLSEKPKEVRFPNPVNAKRIRLRAILPTSDGQDDRDGQSPHLASVAELQLVFPAHATSQSN